MALLKSNGRKAATSKDLIRKQTQTRIFILKTQNDTEKSKTLDTDKTNLLNKLSLKAQL